MYLSRLRLAACTLAIVSVAGCSDSPTAPRLATRAAFAIQPPGGPAIQSLGPVSVTLIAQDGGPATDSAYTVTLSLSSSDPAAKLLGTTTVLSSAGIASFSDLSIPRAGTQYKLVAKVAGLDSAVSSPFNVTTGPATQLRFDTIPGRLGQAVAGGALPVVVRVTDAAGNTATDATQAVTISYTRGNDFGYTIAPEGLFGTTTISPVNGVVSLSSLSFHRSGNNTLTASAPGLTSATSGQVLVLGASAAMSQVRFITQPQSGAAGAVLPVFALRQLDQYGNATSIPPGPGYSVTVALGANPGGATLRGTFTQTGPGVAEKAFNDLVIDKPGTGYTIVATSNGFTATSAPFDIR